MIRKVSFMLLVLVLSSALIGCSSPASSTSAGTTSGQSTATSNGSGSTTTTAKGATTSETVAPGTVLAQIGDVTITQEMFAARLAQVTAQSPTQVPDKSKKPEAYKDFERSVLENMVRLELVTQKAGTIGVAVSDADVQNQIEQVIKQSFGGKPLQVRSRCRQSEDDAVTVPSHRA